MATNLSGEIEYSYHPELKQPASEKPECFNGFRRKDGRAAIRNEIWIIPTVGCVNDVAKRMTALNQDLVTGTIDGLYTFDHPFGCSQTGHDHAQTRKLLAALVRHPNAAAVLVLGLGCENLTHEQFVEELGDYDADRVKFLTCQEVEDEFEAGRKLLEECAAYAGQFHREPIPVSELVVGMKCGGSDGLSGITANPAVGRFSDMLVARGGSTVLTEVPEMFGAEGFLMNRCINKEVFEKAVSMINGFKNYFISHNEVVYDNPSPGNRPGWYYNARRQVLRLRTERRYSSDHGCDRIWGRCCDKGIKYALWTWKRSCISNGDDSSRSAPDSVHNRTRYTIRSAGSDIEAVHEQPACGK